MGAQYDSFLGRGTLEVVPRLPVRDLQVHHELRGDTGPPLLCIMGWRANLDWWPPPLIAALAAKHRVILYDNRGAGRTGDPGGPIAMETLADDAAALLEALAIPRAHVLGVSMGGMIAQELALRRPELVERLVLIATHCGLRRARGSRDIYRAWLRWLGRPWQLEAHLAYLLFSRDLATSDPARWADFVRMVSGAPATRWASFKQLLAIQGHDTWDRLPEIRARTLVIAGERDLMVPPENADILAARIPGARLVKLAGASHAILRERVDDLVQIIPPFLDEAP